MFVKNGDSAAPTTAALASFGRRGKLAQLRYKATDDSGKAREQFTIYKRTKTLAKFNQPLAAAQGSSTRVARWLVPRRFPTGTLRFCVVAIDAAANRSKPSCAPFVVS
jgi:hypothetical protein